MNSEPRKSPRVAAPHILVKVSSPERFRTAYLKDLSDGGLFIKTEKPLPVGTAVSVDLLPPGWPDSLRLRGNVVRVETEAGKSGMGVKLDGNSAEALARLKGLVDEYQSGGAPAIPPAGLDEQIKGLLGQLSDLKSALARKEAELGAERQRREELSSELDLVRSAPAEERDVALEGRLAAELAAAQSEAGDLRTRVAELEGERDAYQQELAVLEKDDATSRRLAASLAKEKTDLTAEVSKLRQQLEDQSREAQRAVEESEARVRALESDAREATAQTSAERDRLREENASLEEAKQRLEGELAAAKTEVANLGRKAAAAEASAKEANAKVEKARARERELRELMEMVTTKGGGGEDVVVMNDDPPSPLVDDEPEPEPETQEVDAAPPPDEPFNFSLETQTDALLPAAPPEASDDESDSSGSLELSVDVEVDGGDEPLPDASKRTDFETRVRSNEPLVKRERFANHVPKNPRQEVVIGLLEASARFPELMVLGRGRLSPPELLDTLFELFVEDVVGFSTNA